MNTIRILTGQGIGDSIWCLPKVQSIAKAFGADRIEMLMACWNPEGIEARGLPVLNRFSFVDEARMHVMPRTTYGPTLLPGWPTDEEGHYRYIPDGLVNFKAKIIRKSSILASDPLFTAIPNRALERGIRLEDWLPEYETNWDVFKDYHLRYAGELKTDLEVFAQEGGKYIVFFMSSAASNGIGSDCGHNNGPLWLPEQWAKLGDDLIRKHGVKIVVVGADYDADYFRRFVSLHIEERDGWVDVIGRYDILTSLAVCKQAKCMVSFQAGIGIIPHYLHTPLAMWWRPGDSSILGSSFRLFCDEKMASAWTYPGSVESGVYKPMFYSRTSVEELSEWCGYWAERSVTNHNSTNPTPS